MVKISNDGASADEGLPEGTDAILALGSNVGDKRHNLAQALEILTARGDVAVTSRSAHYRTEPWGVTDQEWFVNACVGVATKLSPHELLERCQHVETRMGRVREGRWGPRVIDVDILVHRSGDVSEASLTLPHPRIAQRAFVLVPLAEIAPELKVGSRSVLEWLSRIDAGGVVHLAPAST